MQAVESHSVCAREHRRQRFAEINLRTESEAFEVRNKANLSLEAEACLGVQAPLIPPPTYKALLSHEEARDPQVSDIVWEVEKSCLVITGGMPH